MNWKNIAVGMLAIPFIPIIVVVALANELGKDVLKAIKEWKQ